MNGLTKNMLDILSRMEDDRVAAEKTNTEQRIHLAIAMVDAGYKFVRIGFAGSGDSGCIDDISGAANLGDDLETIEPKALYDKIEEWAEQYLSTTNVDWYNNEGGQGYIEFNMTQVPYQFEASIDVNVVTTKTEHYTQEFV